MERGVSNVAEFAERGRSDRHGGGGEMADEPLLEAELGRVVVECADTPAFAGNRIGFKLLNEVAQLAEERGVVYMDQLVGTHTGRALAPRATIDLVGLDVHRAIVDNLYANTHDEAHGSFALPAYMARVIAGGHLGRKTRDKGGFFRIDGKGPDARTFVLDPKTGDYRPVAEIRLTVPGGEIVISRDPGPDEAHEDAYVALRDAFLAAKRQLEDYVRKSLKRGEVRPVERGGAAHGRVTFVDVEKEWGWIEPDDGRRIYFHRNSVLGGIDQLEVGDEVRFTEEVGNEGPQASTVEPIGTHGRHAMPQPST